MLGLLWPVPFVFVTLFVSVRQDLRAQQLEKRMTADQDRIELLGRRLQELRYRLASSTTFARLEPQARERGLQPPRTPQVLAVVPDSRGVEPGGAPEGAAGRLMAGLVEFLGPEAAQAEGRRSADADGEGARPRGEDGESARSRGEDGGEDQLR